MSTDLRAAVAAIRSSRDPEDTCRDYVVELRDLLDAKEEAAQKLFEAPYSDLDLSSDAREELLSLALKNEGWLNRFNEYAALVGVARALTNSGVAHWERPPTPLILELREATSPIHVLYNILRKNKNLTPAQVAARLEETFPQATGGLSEEARDELFSYAWERGHGDSLITVANNYMDLLDLVMLVRFSG